MPTNNVLYPVIVDCVFNNSYTRTTCPPIRTDCIPMSLDCLWVAAEDDLFNCNLCGADEKFYIPYAETDTLMFQTQLTDQRNADANFPVFGWAGDTPTAAFRAQLLDSDGVVVSSDITAFASAYMVARSPLGIDSISYQQFQIDLNEVKNTFGLSCFSIRVNSFIDTGGGPVESKVVYSQPYREVICENNPTLFTSLVRGKFPRFDCCGNYYGLPYDQFGITPPSSVGNAIFQYDNTQRYFANLILDGATVTKESFDNSITKSTVIDQYELHLMEMIPPYMFNIFTKWHYGARIVCVDGVEYRATGDLTKETPDSTTMFLFQAGLTIECENSFTCT